MTVALDSSIDHEWSTDSVCGQSALSCWTDQVATYLTEFISKAERAARIAGESDISNWGRSS